jgi:uncharacterized membrane protein (DUF485 family)
VRSQQDSATREDEKSWEGEIMTTQAPWERITAMPAFHTLLMAKQRFIIPATLFFLVYYFALPLLVGYAPRLMETKVLGVINVAYVFALSQFLMAWILAAFYIRAAKRFDVMAAGVVAELDRHPRGE